MQIIIAAFIHLFALSASFIVVFFMRLIRRYAKNRAELSRAIETRAYVEQQAQFFRSTLQKDLPVGRRLISREQCEWCKLRRLADCVNSYCPEHCRKLCSCGAADFAQKMIDEHGSLREAERVLNKPKELKNSGEEIIEWKPEKLNPKVFRAPVEIWKDD